MMEGLRIIFTTMLRPSLISTTVLCVAILAADTAIAAADAAPGNCARLSPEPQFVESILSGDEGTAQVRAALVIGNGDYTDIGGLANPSNDARDVAERLAALGFTVHYGVDLASATFADCLERFYSELSDADAALLYYAGHGIQVASQNPTTRAFEARNYMLAIDARIDPSNGEAVGFVQVDNVVQRMRNSAATSLVFLDACRDNPLSSTDIRFVDGRSAQTLGRGFAVVNIDEDDVETQAGLYLAYATSPNQTAADGTGLNSPFTAAFLDHVSTPGEPLDTIMTRVKLSVGNTTNGIQIPWTNSSLNLDFHFNGRLARSEFAAQSRSLAQSADVLLANGQRGAAIAAALKAVPLQPGVGVLPETAPAYAALYRALRSNVQLLSGHTEDVQHIAFSTDETRVLTTSADRTARIWDVRSGQQLSMYRAQAYKIIDAIFSSNTPLIATADIDDTSHIRDAATGRVISELSGIDDPYPSMGLFTRDGQMLITLHSGGHGYIWDVASGEKRATLADTDSLARNAAISLNGNSLGTAHDDSVARLWDLRSGASLGELRGHADSVWSIAFAPDDTLIGTASDDRTARLWRRTSSGIVSLHTLRAHTAALRGIEFTPDGKRAITLSLDRTARIWDVASGELLHTLEHDERIAAARIIGSSNILLTKTAGGKLSFWNTESGQMLRSSDEPAAPSGNIAISPRGIAFATTSEDGSVRLSSIRTEETVAAINDDVVAAGWAVFLGRDHKVAAARSDGAVVLLDAKSGIIEHTLGGHDDRITFLTPGPSGALLLSGSYDMTARVWNTETGNVVSVLTGHTDTEYDPAEGVTKPPDEAGNFIVDGLFLDGGERVVTAARRDRVARIWDTRNGIQLASLIGHEGGVRSVTASPDSTMILTTSADGTARTWDSATGAALKTLSGHEGGVRDAAFSPDGVHIVTAGSGDATARIWNAATSTAEKVLRGHTRSVLRARYSADGTAIVTLGGDGQIWVWDAASGNVRSKVVAEKSTGSSDVLFDPDGARLLSKSGQVTRLWDANTGTLLASLDGRGLNSLAHTFDADGSQVLVGGQPLSLWRIGSYDRRLVDAAYRQLPEKLRAEIDRERLRFWIF